MTNRLIHETSPYLLQHAHNPVDWFPWCTEALKMAATQNRPIFLSVGYAACHWCHVMERESFENPQIAAILNENFVSIKVDREERPDIDQIYMQAVMAMRGGQGGWPLSAFLTPEGHAFFGGTYWPPVERMGMPGFGQVLRRVVHAFQNQRDQIEQQSQEVTNWLRRELTDGSTKEGAVSRFDLVKAVDRLHQSYDFEWGGFGGAPKFPHSMHLDFLLRCSLSKDLPEKIEPALAQEMVRLNLDSMACGGIYDQLGGGFSRYSVDERWLVPHFEKMLYDNALLLPVYVNFHRLTRQPRFARVARETADYLLRDMLDSAGAFHSSEDADSEGEEGKFYVWTESEVDALLGTSGPDFRRFYGVTSKGNFEGHNILYIPRLPEKLDDWDQNEFERLAASRKTLCEARSRRVRPGKDDKVLTSWNALAISAFSEAAVGLGNTTYAQAAERAMSFVRTVMRDEYGRLLHTYRRGTAKQPAFLDDYSYLLNACLDLYQVNFDESHLIWAQELACEMIDLFGASDQGPFYFVGQDQPQLIARARDLHDSSVPSGNAAAACGLHRLGLLMHRPEWMEWSQRIVASVMKDSQRHPLAAGQMLIAAWNQLNHREVWVLVAAEQAGLKQAISACQANWRPQASLLARSLDNQQEKPTALDAWFRDRVAINQQPTLYVCREEVCRPPLVGLAAIEASGQATSENG